MTESEKMTTDILIVGGGPAGLACAIELAKANKEREKPLEIYVLEKASEPGRHIVSGCVMEPGPMETLFPDWRKRQDTPPRTWVSKDKLYLLSKNNMWPLPVPPLMKNKGNCIISLSKHTTWLAKEAEKLGVVILSGFPGKSPLFDENGHLVGVKTPDQGLNADGSKGKGFQSGYEIYAKQVVIAEGARGSLTKVLAEHYNWPEKNRQTYGLGVKEVWEVDDAHYEPGLVVHALGWPMDNDTYGGSFIYHAENNKVHVGLIVGLDYHNPTLNIYDELQRFKHHRKIQPLFNQARRIAYGARALNEGGYQAIGPLRFPGGILIGCSAGFLNSGKIKGTHNAIHSGIIAARSIAKYFSQPNKIGMAYEKGIKQSSIYRELKRVRNIRPGFYKGLFWGLMNAGFETITFGKAPWTLRLRQDHKALKPLAKVEIKKPFKIDDKISFTKLDSVALTGTNHRENQPCHLHIKDPKIPLEVNWKIYGGPESYYCPAGVYEYLTDEKTGKVRFQINFQNCIHCKSCDIKDPTQNIDWQCSEGGDGPSYSET